MKEQEAVELLRNLYPWDEESKADCGEIADLIERQSELYKTQAQEIEELKYEILRCRTRTVRIEGIEYNSIDASQVFRLH